MYIIKIDGQGMTKITLTKLESMIRKGDVNPADYDAVSLCYNAHVGLGDELSPEFYPVKFKSQERELWLSYVTLGYFGEGPYGTQKALELMGFYALAKDENLLFERKVVCEEFYKDASQDERIEYHYDQMYETSDSLMRILYKSAINADSIKEFERIAISLKWEGRKARLFRRKVSELTAILRSCIPTDHNIQLLYKLAEYPRKCADEMYATEQKLIQMLNKI